MSEQLLSASVAVIGESLVDAVTTSSGTVEHPGGSAANVALGLARLGREPVLVTALADDARGAMIAEHLTASGVVLAAGSRTALNATSLARATLAEDGSASYEFALDWRLDGVTVPEASILHVGSIGAFVEPGASAVREAVAASTGLVSCDPNIRPSLIGDGERQRLLELAAQSHVVKLSDEDARWLLGTEDPSDVCAALLTGATELVVCTRGAAGLTLATAKRRVDVPPMPAAVVDTVGAGDTVAAAVVDALADDALTLRAPGALAELSEAALLRIGRRAAAAAAITVSRAGAVLPTRAQVDAALV